uniref:Uncharacterized protein n=1 Tax=Lotharella oceanica TaxID=641309 RepID=A0A7S2TVB0_9EUKA|mmetsp:Transcript_28600/g.53611  ORF Transcript_28600/g.53611 Transcript_28600/m.53611 type:complete len:144 (+) Transcript_28600:110-541(+)|eukprot:CAMPEP_0170190508 /NCGR_PEP_ID=MMETSP0040_2-20121228/49511_1 /TAXON_ID=641309 /ORGANISM="Lotharella oceanica, Strain CCMP622" /LENGTH=143 /DNA_ID=CAMNT_0010438381 /DNA_START=40 /DNA_END=471 /DNA_ORIENTATION=+
MDFMTPGLAGALVLGHTTLTKVLMTVMWRGPGSKAAQMGADNWMAVEDKLNEIPLYQIMTKAQLNEAEYAGPLCAALFFCSAKGIDVPIAASLAVFSQMAYYWPRVFLANSKTNHNNGFPFYVPGALACYASLKTIESQPTST